MITSSEKENWYVDKVGNVFDVFPSKAVSEYYYVTSGAYEAKTIRFEHYIVIEESNNQNEQNSNFDPVDKPEHYHCTGIDFNTVMKRTFTKEEYAGFCKGNILKYAIRHWLKGSVEDLKKLRF
ncbi:DUF3310 domain-containing protein [Domibacillus aminovorans]|uniref:DUF3310 domain-containing protein n=1 Tax=Domibacillus aminovorans TaxID=29332 RepID=UPI0009EE5E72|nr:DUF3310 domain-containing protein [Domibacillus aminovorans]